MSEKINENMSINDVLYTMSEGNPGAITVLIQMLQDKYIFKGLPDILLLDSLDIRGSKIWSLYKDCSNQNMDKFFRTLMVLRCGAYSREDIDNNLNLPKSVPFLDDSVKIKGVPDYSQDFGPTDQLWEKYLAANKKVVLPTIRAMVEQWCKI